MVPMKGSPLNISAEDWKYVKRLIAEDKLRRARKSGKVIPGSRSTLRGFNRSGGDLDLGAVVGFDGLAGFDSTAGFGDFKTEVRFYKFRKPTDDDLASGNYGVLLRPAKNDGETAIAIAGVSFALVNVSDAGHKFADLEADSTELKSGSAGPYSIVDREEGTGVKGAEVCRGGESKVLCKPDADVADGASGTVTVWEGETPAESDPVRKIENVFHNWMTDGKKISKDKMCIAELVNGVWRFTHAGCE